MKVKDLILILQEYPEDTKILVENFGEEEGFYNSELHDVVAITPEAIVLK